MKKVFGSVKRNWSGTTTHCALLTVGGALLIALCFQDSLWFDEAYTVGLINHDFMGLLRWSAADVHPPLYYLALKVFTVVFGNSLYVMRIFSALGGILFASLGLTHIKKDYGAKVGFWYSFAVLFSAVTLVYSVEIRMYTWAALMITLTGIYAFRLLSDHSKHNRVLFVVCSVAAAYIQHFAMFTVVTINVLLLIAFFKRKDNSALKKWFIDGCIQIALYIPGALMLLYQIVKGGAGWQTIEWPDLIFDMVSYHVLGTTINDCCDSNGIMFKALGGVFLAMYIAGGALLYRAYKKSNNERLKLALKGAVCAYFGVILFSLTVSLFFVIYYIRYTVVVCGFLFFAIGVLFASMNDKVLKAAAVVLCLLLFFAKFVSYANVVYHPTNNDVKETMDDKVELEDAFIFEGIDTYVVTINYPDNLTYFYNADNWKVHDAYRALGRRSYVIDSLECNEVDELGERVWTNGRGACYKKLVKMGYKEVESNILELKYHSYRFEMILMVK